jgi:hypothetical protein
VPHDRPQASPEEVAEVLGYIQDEVAREIAKKGRGAFVSRHEILGVLHEEYREFEDEVHHGVDVTLMKELRDIAVAAIWGIVSTKKGLDW